MPIRIAFVFPVKKYETVFENFNTLTRLVVPLSFGYLTAYIREKGYNNIRIFDEQLSSLDDRQTFQSLIDYNPDILGITCYSPMYFRSLEIAKTIKELLPKVTIIVGGPQPTLEPESVIKNNNIDFIIRGEGELAFHAFLESFQSGDFSKVPGLAYKVNGQISHNENVVPIMDLDELPIFPYDLFSQEKRYHLGKYISSRGCPYRCKFCGSRYISGKRYRVHSPERVAEDLGIIVKKYGENYVMIYDDNFNISRDRTLRICELILSKGLKFKWLCQMRSDALSQNDAESLELLKIMRKAGCDAIGIGFETGSARLLKEVGKDETIENHIKAIELIKKAKIYVRGQFIIALPTETKKETMETIQFANKHKLNAATFNTFVPFPGTQYYEELKNEGRIIKWEDLNLNAGMIGQNKLPYVPEGRTDEELLKMQRNANVLFWLNLRRIYNFVTGKVVPYGDPHRPLLKEILVIIQFSFKFFIKLFKKSN